MHETKVGAGTCSSCHTGDCRPVGENVRPYNYTLDASLVTDPCEADRSESRFGPTGLDNDGDGLRDAQDADCQALNININVGMADAW